MDYSGYPPHGAAQETAPSLPESYASGTGLNQPQHPAYGYDQTQYGQYEADQPYHQSNAANAPMYQMSGQGPQSASQGYDTYQGTGSIPQQGLNQPNYYQAQMGSGAGHQSAVPNGTTFQNLNGSNYQTNGLVNSDVVSQKSRRISKKWQRRLYWIVPLVALAIALVILFEVFKTDFERWAQPLTRWLQARIRWSWIIPVAILFVLSFPPLFGHEIVQLLVGLTYPLGIAIGIACAGAILGEAACFLLFKYSGTNYTNRKRARSIKWEATARICTEAGFWGVMVIRYSIVPPHLANPLFATTGMSFFVYMASVILSLPKTIVFVALGNPNNSHKASIKVGKVIAFGVLALVTLFASWWIRKRINIATKEIEAERGIMPGAKEGKVKANKQAQAV
ncbi:MAG: Tlg2-vesicle protein [Cyphobasidiales sp. Tagirdzhanova-0007]|nr:MAG: Tlg2-vesicle protein [Cyphobasidiales sp. Tagirdzhanova-0007]